MKKYLKFIILLGIILVFLTGCISELVVPENNENPADGSGTGKGTLKIYLTDAPGDYLEVNIIISKIEGHIAVDGEEGAEGEEESWKILKEWDEGLLVDLTKLEDVSILLASLELEPNKYTQLRLFLKGGENDAWVVLKDSGLTEPLEIPSVYQTGIKLNRPFEIVEGMITELTIDFDAEKSVIKTGNGKYKMKPVISVSAETYSTGELPEGVGSVSGSVSYYDSLESMSIGIGGANIELADGAYIFDNKTTTSGEAGSEGDFSLINVPAGTYTLNVVADGYYNYSKINVEVTADEDTPVVIELLPLGISGIVVNSLTQSPIEGANVSVELDSVITSTVTDTEGIFSIEQLPIGIYDLTISAVGYEVYSDVTPDGGIPVTAEGESDIGTIELTELPVTP